VSGDADLTRERLERLITAMRDLCMPRKFAATYCGVSPKTFERWIGLGATGTGTALHIELAEAVYQIEGLKVGTAIGALERMAMAEPKAAEAFLKLYKPGDFGGPRPEPDEFEALERHAARQDKLLQKPPPRMLEKMRANGWWQFATTLSPEDRATLTAIQAKYIAAHALPEKT
jgi:hypothetical protein